MSGVDAGGVDAVSATRITEKVAAMATPRPWRAQPNRNFPPVPGRRPTIWSVQPVGAGMLKEADAALIVTAVNAHDDLVAALTALVEVDAGPQCTHLMLGGARCTFTQKYHGSPQQFLGPLNNHFFESGPDESPMGVARALLRALDAASQQEEA